MNVHYRSKDWRERILSNLAHTPFTILIGDQEFRCNSVEGFWQGLKATGAMREQVFLLSGFAAKRAGAGKQAPTFEIGGRVYRVGTDDHAALICDAIRQKILQNEKAKEALRASKGFLTHRVSGKTKPIFKMDSFLRQIYKELFGGGANISDRGAD